ERDDRPGQVRAGAAGDRRLERVAGDDRVPEAEHPVLAGADAAAAGQGEVGPVVGDRAVGDGAGRRRAADERDPAAAAGPVVVDRAVDHGQRRLAVDAAAAADAVLGPVAADRDAGQAERTLGEDAGAGAAAGVVADGGVGYCGRRLAKDAAAAG